VCHLSLSPLFFLQGRGRRKGKITRFSSNGHAIGFGGIGITAIPSTSRTIAVIIIVILPYLNAAAVTAAVVVVVGIEMGFGSRGRKGRMTFGSGFIDIPSTGFGGGAGGSTGFVGALCGGSWCRCGYLVTHTIAAAGRRRRSNRGIAVIRTSSWRFLGFLFVIGIPSTGFW